MVAGFGTEAAFLLNGVAALALVVVLLCWRRQLPKDDLPRERLVQRRGHRPALRRRDAGAARDPDPGVRVRDRRLGGPGPAAADRADRLGGGPVVYGLLLGAFGVGAFPGAFLSTRSASGAAPEFW